MIVRRTKKPLPTKFSTHPEGDGILYEKDVRVGSSRIRAKVLVFRNQRSLKKFWKEALGTPLKGRCYGAVSQLYRLRQTFSKEGELESEIMEVDPNFFCVIGLLRDHLTPEILAHESVHAAYSYYRRVRRTPWDAHVREFDEEGVCYPAGRIVNALTDIYWRLRPCPEKGLKNGRK